MADAVVLNPLALRRLSLGAQVAVATAAAMVTGSITFGLGQRADTSPLMMAECDPIVQATRGILRLQFAGTAECASALRSAWHASASYAYGAVWTDFLFIAAYVFALFTGCRWVAALGKSERWRRTLKLGSYAAIAGGLFDVLENVGLLLMLGSVTGNFVPLAVFWLATIKFVLVLGVVLLVLIGWIGHESRRASFLTSTRSSHKHGRSAVAHVGDPGAGGPPPPSKFFSVIAYVWPLRIPLLTASALLALAFSTGKSRYLSGLFDPVAELAVLPIATLALLCAWSAALTLSLVVAYGGDRLTLPPGRRPITRVPGHIWAIGSLIASPVVYFTIQRSHAFSGRSRGAMLLYAAIGAIAACVMLAVTLRSAQWLNDYAAAHRSKGLYHRLLTLVQRSPFFSAGFIDDNASLLPGHGLATFLALVSLITYVSVGYLTRDVSRPEYASALLYVLLLLLVLTWILGLMAFVLDRTRVPLVVYLLIWILLMNAASGVFPTDHEYETFLIDASAPAGTSGDALVASSTTPIVVAASGGGIQASAWASMVLAGLTEKIPQFQQHVQMISAVSGGSVGAMHFLTQHPDCGPQPGPPEPRQSVAVQHSMESSLHAVGWGLVYQDLPRTIVPFLTDPRVDRGLLMEDAWKRDPRLGAMVDPGAPNGRDALLSSWQRNVPDGKCPGAIFNAMVANTGEPMLFTTVALPNGLKRFAFQSHYPKLDVKLTTAARLSATFPYVTPAAHAQHDADPSFARKVSDGVTETRYNHVVDGGYFDNFGVASATAWIHGALQEEAAAQRPKRILLIEICESNSCSSDNPGDAPSFGGDERRSWSFQLYAPISALLAMRTSAQRARNRWQIELLKERWNPGVCVESVKFAYPAEPGPMSWHLTEGQKKSIEQAWTGAGPQSAAAQVAQFVTRVESDTCR